MNIFTIAISIWTTSTLFMLFYYFNAVVTTRSEGLTFRIPLWLFIWVTFVPFVHTYKCFRIMARARQLAKENEEKRGM